MKKVYKYSSVNSYSLQNIQNSQIYFSNPLEFNDPFDTLHPSRIEDLSIDTFAYLFCKMHKRKFKESTILAILKKKISRKEFYTFCEEHIDYFFDFDNKN